MFKYLLSREFRNLFVLLAGIFLLVLILIFYVFLPSYTRQGEQVTVPDVGGMDHEAAIHMLETTDLSFQLDTLYDFNPQYPPLAVTKQDPPAMSKVKPGRKIYLYINRDAPSQVPFPDIINKSLFEARAELEKWGLKVGRIQYVEGDFANLVEKAHFKNRTIRPGDKVDKFSTIVLTVSKGPGENVEYISVTGMLVGEAVNAIQNQGLIVGQIKFDPASREDAGLVLKQFPAYHSGDSLARGTSITVFVAGEEPEEATEAIE